VRNVTTRGPFSHASQTPTIEVQAYIFIFSVKRTQDLLKPGPELHLLLISRNVKYVCSTKLYSNMSLLNVILSAIM